MTIIKISMQTSCMVAELMEGRIWKRNCYQFFFSSRLKCQRRSKWSRKSFGLIFIFCEFAYRESRDHLVYIPLYILPTICQDKQTTNRINIQRIPSTMRGHRAHRKTSRTHPMRKSCCTNPPTHTHTLTQHPPFDLVI